MGENFDSYECEQVRCSLPLVIINAKQAWKEKERVLTLFLTPFSGSGSGYRVRRRNHPSVIIIATGRGEGTRGSQIGGVLLTADVMASAEEAWAVSSLS